MRPRLSASCQNCVTKVSGSTVSTGPDTTVTEMGQQLVNRLNGATTSIDATIYSLNRVSIRW